MKLFAKRGVQDSDHVEFLLEACGVESLEEAKEIDETCHAPEVLSSSAEARVRHWLDQHSRPRPSSAD